MNFLQSFSVSRARQGGFSLVEILAGMLIALIGILVMTKVFSDSESAKRSVSSGGDAQANGGIASYSLGRELRFAGYGLNGKEAMGCHLLAYNAARSVTDFEIDSLAPVMVFPAGQAAKLADGVELPAADADTDMVMVAYGSADIMAEPVGFNDQTANPDASKVGYGVQSRGSFTVGDIVLAAESGKNCALFQVTSLPGAADYCGVTDEGNSGVVRFSNGSFKNPYAATSCDSQVSDFNSDKALQTYSANGNVAKLYNLGRGLNIHVYAVRNGSLTSCDVMAMDCTKEASWIQIAPNIVNLQVRMGYDTTAVPDGAVDVFWNPWQKDGESKSFNAFPDELDGKTAACRASRVSAVRIGLVARSNQFEKDIVTGTDAGAADALKERGGIPSWQKNPLDAAADPEHEVFALGDPEKDPAAKNWQNYRYRLFETILPLRNMVWKGPDSGC